ncbi:ParA family protein [Microbacterium suaedae]|uniref:ParA family protein n=1 Tax=Microbacterium suaedae TaxID=2067813 RepID=UPI0013A67803|nr:ParA family protein [Microbacterium suaedae]
MTDTPPAVGFITLAALAAADVERLVCKYNDGKPFQPIGAGVMVPGRRKGE